MFVASSANGTLFHELRFLNYHPDDRFSFHHLVARTDDAVVSVIPGGIVDRDDGKWFASPVGASVGGPVVLRRTPIRALEGVIHALQDHVRAQGFVGIRLTIAPSIYEEPPDEKLGFVLAASGFSLTHRWISFVMDLKPAPTYSKTRRYEVRKASKQLQVREAQIEELDTLYEILLDNQTALGSRPTHSKLELKFLKERFPNRVRFYLCGDKELDVAGMVVFILNQRVAYVFYTFERQEHRGSLAPAFVVDHVGRAMAKEGFRYLDLGPTSFDSYQLNEGLAFFKESFGAYAVCRDQWTWVSSA